MKRSEIEIVSIEKLKGSMNDEHIAMYIVQTKNNDHYMTLRLVPTKDMKADFHATQWTYLPNGMYRHLKNVLGTQGKKKSISSTILDPQYIQESANKKSINNREIMDKIKTYQQITFEESRPGEEITRMTFEYEGTKEEALNAFWRDNQSDFDISIIKVDELQHLPKVIGNIDGNIKGAYTEKITIYTFDNAAPIMESTMINNSSGETETKDNELTRKKWFDLTIRNPQLNKIHANMLREIDKYSEKKKGMSMGM